MASVYASRVLRVLHSTSQPQVIYIPETQKMRMWYRGAGWGFPSSVGVADSLDGGKTWIKYKHNPVYIGVIISSFSFSLVFLFSFSFSFSSLATSKVLQTTISALASRACGTHLCSSSRVGVVWSPCTQL